MGRGKVQLKRMENKVNRQVTFSKRRGGLLKKADEISVLCDVDVALIIFSTSGKLYEYATNSSMERILGRYERYHFAERELTAADLDSQGEWSSEYTKLKSKVESLQKRQRQLNGEDLESLCMKELQNLEQQLETGLKQVRATKNHQLFDSISDLERKEKMLQDQNKRLQKKLREQERETEALTLHARLEQPNPPAARFALPLNLNSVEPLPTDIMILKEGGTAKQRQKVLENHTGNNELPTWMLRLGNG